VKKNEIGKVKFKLFAALAAKCLNVGWQNHNCNREVAKRVEMLFFNYHYSRTNLKKSSVKPLRIEIILSLSE